MNLPCFSRSQVGIVLLLGTALLLLYSWRANFWRPPSPAAPPPQNLIFIEITGAVTNPGVHTFSTPPTLLAALDQAGGPALELPANPTLASGSRIDVDPAGRCRVGRMAGSKLLTLGLPVNLNEATAGDLEALPGIGPVLAGRIVAHRNQHGPFRRLEDLQQVSGIGPPSLEQLKPHLSLETPPN